MTIQKLKNLFTCILHEGRPTTKHYFNLFFSLLFFSCLSFATLFFLPKISSQLASNFFLLIDKGRDVDPLPFILTPNKNDIFYNIVCYFKFFIFHSLYNAIALSDSLLFKVPSFKYFTTSSSCHGLGSV